MITFDQMGTRRMWITVFILHSSSTFLHCGFKLLISLCNRLGKDDLDFWDRQEPQNLKHRCYTVSPWCWCLLKMYEALIQPGIQMQLTLDSFTVPSQLLSTSPDRAHPRLSSFLQVMLMFPPLGTHVAANYYSQNCQFQHLPLVIITESESVRTSSDGRVFCLCWHTQFWCWAASVSWSIHIQLFLLSEFCLKSSLDTSG